eukprot:Skav212732  [mRNA]  locus=scaffold3052:40428:74854:+ [translate_table: standard]
MDVQHESIAQRHGPQAMAAPSLMVSSSELRCLRSGVRPFCIEDELKSVMRLLDPSLNSSDLDDIFSGADLSKDGQPVPTWFFGVSQTGHSCACHVACDGSVSLEDRSMVPANAANAMSREDTAALRIQSLARGRDLNRQGVAGRKKARTSEKKVPAATPAVQAVRRLTVEPITRPELDGNGTATRVVTPWHRTGFSPVLAEILAPEGEPYQDLLPEEALSETEAEQELLGIKAPLDVLPGMAIALEDDGSRGPFALGFGFQPAMAGRAELPEPEGTVVNLPSCKFWPPPSGSERFVAVGRDSQIDSDRFRPWNRGDVSIGEGSHRPGPQTTQPPHFVEHWQEELGLHPESPLWNGVSKMMIRTVTGNGVLRVLRLMFLAVGCQLVAVSCWLWAVGVGWHMPQMVKRRSAIRSGVATGSKGRDLGKSHLMGLEEISILLEQLYDDDKMKSRFTSPLEMVVGGCDGAGLSTGDSELSARESRWQCCRRAAVSAKADGLTMLRWVSSVWFSGDMGTSCES